MSEISNKSETIDKHSVVCIRFRPSSKIYLFEADGIDAKPGMWIVAETEMGVNLGRIVRPKYVIKEPEQPLKKILRIASEEDIETDRNNWPFEDEAKAFCIDKVKSRNLPMKIVATETTLDRKRLIFYFTADGRIDFRELVRDLAAKFKTRIEMRQIGVRDEVKMLGGIGACGRETCCSLFLESFEPVSIRMAKQQELTINQGKLSGICGRLMCCLGYEYGYEYEYEESEESAPSKAEDKTTLTVTEKSSAGRLQPMSMAPGCTEELLQPHVCSCDKHICPPPQPEKIVEEQKPVNSKPGKRKKGKSGKSHPLKSQPGSVSHTGEPQGHEGKKKGNPFSKRRNFLKKKKH